MKNKLLNLAVAVGLALSASSANAALYNFTQIGFDNGASVSGSFQASDLDGDGLLEGGTLATIQEITAFTLTFSGNSIVPAFTHTLSDLTFLNYRFSSANNTLGENNPEGIATRWFDTTGYTYVSGLSTNGQNGAGIINWQTDEETISEQLITVTPAAVPVPGAVWLFGSALIGLVGLKRSNA